VLGVDFDDRYLDQARLAAEVEDADIEFRKLSVYDLAKLSERFDLVIFMGVLYHLRHPLLALDLIHEHVADDLLLFQSMQRGANEIFEPEIDYDFSQTGHFDRPDYPKLHFIEHRYAGDWTNWWAPNASASAAMLRSAGFQVLDRPEEEVFLCRRTERPTEAGAVYPARSPLNGHDKTKEPRR
jgi:tRNA (mo5U34)-methyltransferase